MNPSFAGSFDALGSWRQSIAQHLFELARFLDEHDLHDGTSTEVLASLQARLSGDKLVVAFVAEFSRGKSELINAIFFADAGRRILPATPGRTTMCPVQIGYDAERPSEIALLPIATRTDGLAIAELVGREDLWKRLPLDPQSPGQIADALREVTHTERVDVETARALGFWHDDRPADNPPVDADGRVEVPAWRHAVINVPHPLLRRGLVVLDTPGLNAVGAEPELTLNLLPGAHACVFVLAADTGVTRSDLDMWRDQISTHPSARYVVLNKIDALADPLATPEQVEAQIEHQRDGVAATLGVPAARVFPLSARQALAARVRGNAAELAASRLGDLEVALASQLLPQRRQLLQQMVADGLVQVESQIARHFNERRRAIAEQTLELRGVRGKSGPKLRMMLERVEQENAEFERCTAQLQAMRTVHLRLLKDVQESLTADRVRDEVAEMQRAASATLFGLGAKKAFAALCGRLRAVLESVREQAEEIHKMLAASFTRLNTEFGFSLNLASAPDLEPFSIELDMIERNYVKYLGLSNALRLGDARFVEQFRRMLISKVRVVFENAGGEVEQWSRAASSQVDTQLRERRKTFRRRREALERVQSATGDLDGRLAELGAQEAHIQQVQQRLALLIGQARAALDTSGNADGAVPSAARVRA